MNEKELKTSPKQRIVISLIAVVMLGSIIASYAAIILNGGKSNSASADGTISEEKIMEYETAYSEKVAEFQAATKSDFDKFYAYHTEIRAYNEAAANSGTVTTRDILEGNGRELTAGDTDYYAYYVGWCADESVFDSSFDNNDNPTAFSRILDANLGLIEGWNTGVVGMKINGIREVTIPGNLAYGETTEICGGYNKPLKFLIMPKQKSEDRVKMATELDTALMRYQYALYGIDYDTQMTQ